MCGFAFKNCYGYEQIFANLNLIDVENLLIANDIKILCLQEVEIDSGYDQNIFQLKKIPIWTRNERC